MKLFDGTENYELDSFHVHCQPHKPPVIHVNIVKDVNCQTVFDPSSKHGGNVFHVGKKYDHPDIHRYSLKLSLLNVGHFNVHPTSMHDHDRLYQLRDALNSFKNATLSITVRLKGDEVKDECQMKPFEIQLRAQTNRHWSYMFYDKTRVVGIH